MDATASGARGIAGRVFPCERSAGARTNGAANRLDETGRMGTRSGESFGGTGADGEVVWSWRPGAGAKFVRSKLLRNDGGNKPVTGESAK